MAKRYVVRYPNCRCNGFTYSYGWQWSFDHWHAAKERGEWVPVPICKKGLGCLRWECYPYTPLRQCERCKRVGNKRQIAPRHDVYDNECNRTYYTLCMSCWNKLRPIIYALRLYRECQSLANKIRRRAVKSKTG